MFKICKLRLWNQDAVKEYNLGTITYIYGSNSVGKTLFAECIDFILGTTEDDILKKDGMENITAIEAFIANNKLNLWVKRDSNARFYYKLAKSDKYSLVSRESYVEEISKIIFPKIEDNDQLKVYQNVFEESPTFRAFTFLNFITESHQGDLEQIFTKGDEIKNIIRIRKIMLFFFYYKNIEVISKKQEELDQNQREFNILSKKQTQYQYLFNKIRIGFQKLNLDFTGNNDTDRKTLYEFKKNFNRPQPKVSGDLIYLSRASFSLSEELKQYNFLLRQSKKAKNRKNNDEALLKLLETLSIENPKNSKYLKSIQKEIKSIQDDKALLSLANYNSAIKQIIEEKKKIDVRIKTIESQTNELDYDDATKQILILEQLLSDFIDFTDSDKLTELEEKNKQLKKEIRDLREHLDKENINKFNENLLEMYFDPEVEREVKYVREDKMADGFSFSFNPLEQQLMVKKNDKVDPNQEAVQISFIPGSLARRTHIQILVYLLMLKYVTNNFLNMRVLPLLVIDSADQAFKKSNFKYIYPEIIKYAKQAGIQLIFISKEFPDNGNDYPENKYIDITKGFNPFHSK